MGKWFWKKIILCIYILFINTAVKRNIVAFPFNVKFIALLLDYFYNYTLCLVCFLQFFFIKSFKNFFSTYVDRTVFLKIFAKIFLYFYIFTWPPFLNLRFSLSLSLLKSICARLYINILFFNCAMICIVVLINYVS